MDSSITNITHIRTKKQTTRKDLLVKFQHTRLLYKLTITSFHNSCPISPKWWSIGLPWCHTLDNVMRSQCQKIHCYWLNLISYITNHSSHHNGQPTNHNHWTHHSPAHQRHRYSLDANRNAYAHQYKNFHLYSGILYQVYRSKWLRGERSGNAQVRKKKEQKE